MLKLSLKDRYASLDSDQRAILWSFVCTTLTTFIVGSIFKGGVAFLIAFIPAWVMLSWLFGRKNKSVEKEDKFIASNGKEFTRREKRIYWAFFWAVFILGIPVSIFVSALIPIPESGMVLIFFVPYVCCTIYGFIKRIPLNTFLEGSKNYQLSSNFSSIKIEPIKSPLDPFPNKANLFRPGGLF